MTTPKEDAHPETFERIEEYTAVLGDVGRLDERRQNNNTLYVGLNTIFLTALGIFISMHLSLTNWGTALAVIIITVAILPLNIVWLATINSYARSLGLRFDYLREIEQEFRQRRDASTVSDERSTQKNSGEIGLFLQIKQLGLHRGRSNTGVERLLAAYFLGFYPAISLALVVLTILTQHHTIAPLTLP